MIGFSTIDQAATKVVEPSKEVKTEDTRKQNEGRYQEIIVLNVGGKR